MFSRGDVFIWHIKKQKVIDACTSRVSHSVAFGWVCGWLWWWKKMLCCAVICVLIFSFFLGGVCIMMMSGLTQVWFSFSPSSLSYALIFTLSMKKSIALVFLKYKINYRNFNKLVIKFKKYMQSKKYFLWFFYIWKYANIIYFERLGHI